MENLIHSNYGFLFGISQITIIFMLTIFCKKKPLIHVNFSPIDLTNSAISKVQTFRDLFVVMR